MRIGEAQPGSASVCYEQRSVACGSEEPERMKVWTQSGSAELPGQKLAWASPLFWRRQPPPPQHTWHHSMRSGRPGGADRSDPPARCHPAGLAVRSRSGPGEAPCGDTADGHGIGSLNRGGHAEPFMSSAQVATLDCTRPCPICHHPMDLSRIETVPWGRRTAGERLDFCCTKCGMIRTEWTAIPFLAAPETAPT
jgi:hypothetical protein